MTDQPPGLETWKEHVEPIERMRAVAETVQQPRPRGWIAYHAGVGLSEGRDYVQNLASQGIIRKGNGGYEPVPEAITAQQVRRLLDSYDSEELHDMEAHLESAAQHHTMDPEDIELITRQQSIVAYAIDHYDEYAQTGSIPTPELFDEASYDPTIIRDRVLHVVQRELDRHPLIERVVRHPTHRRNIWAWIDGDAAGIPRESRGLVVLWTAGQTPGENPEIQVQHTNAPRLLWRYDESHPSPDGSAGSLAHKYLRRLGGEERWEPHWFVSLSPPRIVWQVLDDVIPMYRDHPWERL